jgi:hypothetical protein
MYFSRFCTSESRVTNSLEFNSTTTKLFVRLDSLRKAGPKFVNVVRQRRPRGLTWAFPLTCGLLACRPTSISDGTALGIFLPRTPTHLRGNAKELPCRRRLSQPKLLVEQHKPHGNYRSMKSALIFSPMSCPLYLRVLLVPMKPKTQLAFVAHSQFSYMNTFSSWGCSSKYAFISTALPLIGISKSR